MASYNKVILAGNLTRDPELGATQNSKTFCKFGLAVNEGANSTMFVDCVAWDKTAEICDRYLNKGSSVLVDGRLRLESWEKDGQKRSRHIIVVDRLQMLDKPVALETTPETTEAAAASQGGTVPF